MKTLEIVGVVLMLGLLTTGVLMVSSPKKNYPIIIVPDVNDHTNFSWASNCYNTNSSVCSVYCGGSGPQVNATFGRWNC